MMSNGPPARPDGTVDDARWLFPQERAPPPRIPQTTNSPSSSFGFSHSEWLGFSLSEDHSAAIHYFDWRIPLVHIAVAEFKKRFESAIYNQLPSSVVNRCYEEWQLALAFLRSSEDKRSCHQAVLSLERDTVACDHLRQVHLTRSSAQVMTPPSPTTTTTSSPPSLTHPTSYLGVVIPPTGGDFKLSSHVPQATTAQESAAIMTHRTARRRKRPRRRPCRRNRPRAPNNLDEAIPSHPLPITGGTSMPTTTHLASARANDRDHRSNMSSPSLLPMTLPSPSHQPFTIEGGNSTYSGGGFNDSFRDNGAILPPRKCPRRKYRPRRVCRRHNPRAPNPLDHLLCGGRHRPRASNQSTVS